MQLPPEQRAALVKQQAPLRALLVRERQQLIRERKMLRHYTVEALVRDTSDGAWGHVAQLLDATADNMSAGNVVVGSKRKQPPPRH
jgi:hypothetical protein